MRRWVFYPILDAIAFFIGTEGVFRAYIRLLEWLDDRECDNAANELRVSYWRETGEWL